MSDDKKDSEIKEEYCTNFKNVIKAANRIEGKAHRTPVLTCSSIDKEASGRKIYFKVEAMQKTGSFKFRGAMNAIQTVLQEHAKSGKEPLESLSVVTHSSGNHAQAVALAAKLSSTEQTPLSATIVMPKNTPVVKKAAVADFGGNIVMVDNTNEAREDEAERIQKETGATFVHPSEDPQVIAGQGTVCLELVHQCQEMKVGSLDAVIIPVGGGGLAAGNTISLRALLGSKVKIILAEPSELDDAKRSFEAKELLKHSPDNKLDSVADGLKTTLGPNTWPIIRDMVDDVLTVTEKEILKATKLIWERLKVCIEPSAGVGVAVALSDTFNKKYPADEVRNVGIILCGGNVDILRISSRMQEMDL